jgi:glutamyl-tRNA synthetase
MDTPDKKQNKVVTRFAPSPTGFMHFGSIRTAIFAYLWARKNNGTFILRIEDTDKEREVEGSIEHIIKSLRWMGIDYDFGPDKERAPFGSCIQSERLDTYIEFAKKLIEKGYAYPDPYSKEELEAFRKQADAEKKPFLYRNHRPEHFEVWDGKKPLRLKVPEVKRYKWTDAVRGELEAGEEALDDLILIKSDGYPTYNFAHIIDDYYMGATHIFRGEEFISSTPRFLSIYDALGFEYPVFVTMPVILREDRTKKLGKRDGAKDILDYAKEGYLPEALFNTLALIGWNPGTEQEIFNKSELITAFELSHIHKAGGVFNEDKLDWMNREYLKKMSYEEQEEYIVKFLPESITSLPGYSNTIVHNIAPVIMERISKGKDVTDMAEAGELDYYFDKPKYSTDALFFKSSKIPANDREVTLTQYLNHVIGILEMITPSEFNKEAVKEKIWPYTESGEVASRGDVLWPIRFALSGREKSPDPFTLAEILGKEETIARLQTAIEILSQ